VEQQAEDDVEGTAKYTARTDRDFLLSTTSSKGQAKQFPGSRLFQFSHSDKVQDAVLDPNLEILRMMRMYLAVQRVWSFYQRDHPW